MLVVLDAAIAKRRDLHGRTAHRTYDTPPGFPAGSLKNQIQPKLFPSSSFSRMRLAENFFFDFETNPDSTPVCPFGQKAPLLPHRLSLFRRLYRWRSGIRHHLSDNCCTRNRTASSRSFLRTPDRECRGCASPQTLSALSDERVDSRGNLAGQILLDHGDRLLRIKSSSFER